MAGKITDVQLRHWIRAGRPLAKAQGEVAGLTFTLSASGTASWVLRYRFGGKQRELTLGRYPDIGVAEAKRLALAERAKIHQGADPARDKRLAKLERAGSMTLAKLAEDYSGKIVPTLATNTRRMRQSYIDDIVSSLGPILAKDLTGADVVGLIERVGRQRGAIVAGKLMGALRGLMAHGVAKRVIASDPAHGIRVMAICGAEPAPRQRLMLGEEEIRVLMTTSVLPESPHLAVKIMLGTCVRVSELVEAKWEHVDLTALIWTVPKSKTSSEPFRIPLSKPVAGWLTRLRELARSSAWVLPSPNGKAPRTASSIRDVLRDRDIGIRKFSPHDLRSTARSHLAQLGVNPEIAERCLNHHVPGLVGIYDKHDRFDERRRALALLGDFLEACEAGTPWTPAEGNVVPIRHVR